MKAYIITFKEYGTYDQRIASKVIFKDIKSARKQLGIIKANIEGSEYSYYNKDSYISENGDTWEIKEMKVV